jgi:hypothetical protein
MMDGTELRNEPCTTCGAFSNEPCLEGCGKLVSYRIEYGARPWTTNSERAGNRWQRATNVKEWRQAFFYLAKAQKIPQLKWATITIEPWQKGGVFQDVASCNPAAKAAIDGIVDAKILEDDSPEFLKAITFLRPQRGKNAMVLYLQGVMLMRGKNE